MAPNNLNNIIGKMRAGGGSSALTPYSGGTVSNEAIDERILRLLGLENEFELSYEEYVRHLKEALSVISLGKSRFSTEEAVLFQTEFKRVKSKKKENRFKVKKKKITASNVGLKSGAIVKYQAGALSKNLIKSPSGGEVDKSVGENLKSINETLDKILKSIVSQGQSDRKRREKERISGERRKAQERESGLEKPLQVAKGLVKKIIAPFQGILDRIFRFLGFTFLGWLIGKFDEIQKWMANNKDKVNIIKRFLKDWWPSLLFAAGLFLTPFGKFVRTTLKTIRWFIPRIIGLIRTHPMLAAAAAAGIGAAVVEQQIKGRRDEAKKLDPSIVTPEDTAKTGQGPGPAQLYGEQTQRGGFGQMFAKGGKILGFGNGASLKDYFSGIVGKDTGMSVTGFGKDTQAFPVQGGGTAVLAPGESVLQVGARERMMKETGYDPLAFNVGANANRPFNFTYKGGGVVGMQGGGILGMFGGGSRGLGFGGVRAGFTGMAKEGFEAIMGGANFRNPNKPSLIGKGSRPVLGHGAYSAPTARGASRYVKPGGGIVKSIVPGGARGINFIEPQSVVKPSTFDKGKLLADKLLRGEYGRSKLANQLRSQLMSGAGSQVGRAASGLGGLLGPIATGVELGNLISPFAIEFARQRRQAQAQRYTSLIPGGTSVSGMPARIVPAGYQSGGVLPVSGGRRGADNLFIPPMFLQPGERLAVLTKRSVQMGAIDAVNKTLAELDPNSRSARTQNLKSDIGPKVTFINLPNKVTSPPGKGGGLTPGKPKLPEFSVIMDSPKRMEVAEALGIADLV